MQSRVVRVEEYTNQRHVVDLLSRVSVDNQNPDIHGRKVIEEVNGRVRGSSTHHRERGHASKEIRQ